VGKVIAAGRFPNYNRNLLYVIRWKVRVDNVGREHKPAGLAGDGPSAE
jgi:hypothetical protein